MSKNLEKMLANLQNERDTIRAELAVARLAANPAVALDITTILAIISAILPLINKCLNRPEPTPVDQAIRMRHELDDGRKKNGNWKAPLVRRAKTASSERLTDDGAIAALNELEGMTVPQLTRMIENAKAS